MISHICSLKCNSLKLRTLILFKSPFKGYLTTQFVFEQAAVTVGLTVFLTALQEAGEDLQL